MTFLQSVVVGASTRMLPSGRQHVARVQGLDRFQQAPVLEEPQGLAELQQALEPDVRHKVEGGARVGNAFRTALAAGDRGEAGRGHPRVILMCLAVRSPAFRAVAMGPITRTLVLNVAILDAGRKEDAIFALVLAWCSPDRSLWLRTLPLAAGCV